MAAFVYSLFSHTWMHMGLFGVPRDPQPEAHFLISLSLHCLPVCPLSFCRLDFIHLGEESLLFLTSHSVPPPLPFPSLSLPFFSPCLSSSHLISSHLPQDLLSITCNALKAKGIIPILPVRIQSELPKVFIHFLLEKFLV
jgi:hypothetical protein